MSYKKSDLNTYLNSISNAKLDYKKQKYVIFSRLDNHKRENNTWYAILRANCYC